MIRTCISSMALTLTAALGSAHEASSFHAGQAPSEKAAEIVDKLRQKYQEVSEDLNKQDVSAATRAKQGQIVDLIDELLRRQNEPPPNSEPPPSNNNPPPSTDPPPASKSAEPMPQDSAAPKTLPKNLEQMPGADPQKWPSLPPRERGDIDAYRRSRFVPGYESLLGEYYRRIAESRRRDRE